LELLERDDERAVLEAAVDESRTAGRVVLVLGEAGIGNDLAAGAVLVIDDLHWADDATLDLAALPDWRTTRGAAAPPAPSAGPRPPRPAAPCARSVRRRATCAASATISAGSRASCGSRGRAWRRPRSATRRSPCSSASPRAASWRWR
jgi:hypothetical protein